MASISDNGTVSIATLQGYAAGYYAPYYDLLAKATQQHIAPTNNTYEAFHPAPTLDPPLITESLFPLSPPTPPSSKRPSQMQCT